MRARGWVALGGETQPTPVADTPKPTPPPAVPVPPAVPAMRPTPAASAPALAAPLAPSAGRRPAAEREGEPSGLPTELIVGNLDGLTASTTIRKVLVDGQQLRNLELTVRNGQLVLRGDENQKPNLLDGMHTLLVTLQRGVNTQVVAPIQFWYEQGRLTRAVGDYQMGNPTLSLLALENTGPTTRRSQIYQRHFSKRGS